MKHNAHISQVRKVYAQMLEVQIRHQHLKIREAKVDKVLKFHYFAGQKQTKTSKKKKQKTTTKVT